MTHDAFRRVYHARAGGKRGDFRFVVAQTLCEKRLGRRVRLSRPVGLIVGVRASQDSSELEVEDHSRFSPLAVRCGHGKMEHCMAL
jgi:hypothetical protein